MRELRKTAAPRRSPVRSSHFPAGRTERHTEPMPFASLGLDAALLRGVRELGFTRPTRIPTDAIPHAVAGRDVLACATTGSGKTAAFVLPILHKLLGKPRGTTRALVLTPTRELAGQIAAHLNDLARAT